MTKEQELIVMMFKRQDKRIEDLEKELDELILIVQELVKK